MSKYIKKKYLGLLCVILFSGLFFSVKPATAASASISDQYGTILISGGQYIVQNNVWGATTAQTITVPDTNVAAFTVSVSEHDQGSVAAYPSIYKGDHWGLATTGHVSPQVSSASASYSWSVSSSRPSGTYNIAAEAWLSPNPTGDGGYNGGAEIMIWLDSQGMVPAGSQIGTYGSYQVWYSNMGWNYVCYFITGRSSGSYNLMDFIGDAMSRGYVQSSWYLHDIEAGFELMSGGQGLTVNSFSASISGGGVPTTTTPPPTTTTPPPTTTTPPPSGEYQDISIPFTYNGAGDLLWRTTTTPEYINSWNLQTLTVNGVDFTNTFVSASNLPAKQNGYYYIHYVGNYRWSHFEAVGTATPTTTTPPPTTTTTTTPTTTTPTTTTTTTTPTTTTPPPTTTAPPGDYQTISAPFTYDGSGDRYWRIATIPSYVNCWNLASLTINGVDFTNTYVSARNLPAKIDGYYYIHYVGNYRWSHVEIR